jgi:hypothetical protein
MTPCISFATYRHKERGSSLFIGLIMLVLMTLLAISAFQSSNVNLRIVGNMQTRQEILAAVQSATEQVISTPTFIKTTPPNATVTLNGASYTVDFATVPPACVGVVDIPSEDLDPTNADDALCIPSGQIKQSGIFVSGTPLPPSYCANTKWELTAKVGDANTGADTTFAQGVAVRISKPKALSYCP